MLKKTISITILIVLLLIAFVLFFPRPATQAVHAVLGEGVVLSTLPILSNNIIDSPEADAPLSIENIIDATNAERVKAGLPPLKTSDKLAQSAKIKVNDMITNDYFEHTSPDGKTVADLGKEVGYDYVVMGENLAVGDFTTAQDLLTAWMNSPGHRANILNTSYEDIGVYAAQGTYQGRTVWFAVQHFGTERGVCPEINATLKTEIDTLNTSIKHQENVITALRAQIEDPNHTTGPEYNRMISQFNILVAKYNHDLATSQLEINNYNAQVIAFNKCLSQYQVTTPSDTK